MALIRTIALPHLPRLLAMLLLLPWGALAGGHVAAASAALAQAAIAAPAGGDVAAPVQASAKRKCRLGGLPGSPCGPDQAVAAGDAAASPPPGRSVAWPAAAPRGAGVGVEPPRGPPRLF